MKLGFSACNFPHRNLAENIRYAGAEGFDFVEAHGQPFAMSLLSAPDYGRKTAALLRREGVEMTVHHALPDPCKEEACAAFRTQMQALHAFAAESPETVILSFDTWVDRTASLPQLLFALQRFSDLPIAVLTEDFPLNSRDLALWQAAAAYPRYGLLCDVGHMNVRLCDTGNQPIWCLYNEGENLPLPAGDNTPQAFAFALAKKPLPIRQLHLHNNDGTKDDHRALSDGTADYAAIAAELKKLGFDGYADLELSPTIHGVTGAAADAQLLADRDLWRTLWDRA